MSGIDLSAVMEENGPWVWTDGISERLRWDGPRRDSDTEVRLGDWLSETLIPLVETAVRESIAAEIEADRTSVLDGSDLQDLYARGVAFGLARALRITGRAS